MAYKQYPTDKYLKEIQQRLRLVDAEKPIIDKYYTEFRAKIKPIIEQLPENPNESQLRNYIINELSPILKDQTSNFVENLSKSNDLMAFYRFGKTFLNTVKDIRNLDSAFLADLWSKFKSKLKIEAEAQLLPKTGLTASEYENALKHNRKVASSFDLENPQIVIHPGPKVESRPDTTLKQIVVHSNYHHPLSSIQSSISGPAKKARNLRFKKSLSPLDTNLKQYPNKGSLNTSYDVEHLAHTNPYGYKSNSNQYGTKYTKIPRKGPVVDSILAKQPTGFPVGRPPKLTESNIKVFDKRTGTYKKSSNPASSTAMSTYGGEGLRMHPKFAGRGILHPKARLGASHQIVGITTYARR